MIRRLAVITVITVALGISGQVDGTLTARNYFATFQEARDALETARMQQRNARARVERLELQASQSREAAQQAVQQSAAMAARVQQAEAGIDAAEARLAIARRQRRDLDRRLADRRAPLVRLTAALQSMSRRPLALSALQTGSLRDLVYTRAVLDSTIPLVASRTLVLRSNLDRARELEAEEFQALSDRRNAESVLRQRRSQLVALAEKERLKANQAAGGADQETRRALVLAEQAIDLDQLVGQLENAADLRTRLAALPGPIPRPVNPSQAATAPRPVPTPSATAPPARYQLPVIGQVIAGFGASGESGARQNGLSLSARARAQIVSPGAGRIAFAGPYRGYGRIVIVEHANGWTSLVTGLASLDVGVGQRIAAGSALGLAAGSGTPLTLELRRNGEPVNPLDYLQ